MTDESLFAQALAISDAAQRAAFLDRACAGNPGLRREVEELLAAHFAAGSPLDRPAADRVLTDDYRPQDDPPAASVGDRVGRYRLMEQIGEGGFGLVFVAEQQEPVRRKVALKVLKPGMDTRAVVARFEAERQALALMDHPNIAKVFDAGSTEAGRPYFVMELVRGVPITDYCDQQKLAPRERLALFVQVCQAVQHAHQKGVIHRDIKPSNVLVTSHDGVPVPKVIDFGVAKAVGHSLTEKTVYTRFAQMIGTPLYMSPEQAEMSGLDVDTRSDIYSLGVLLYELLTGTTPFDRDRFRRAAFDEIRRIIREEEPPRPSTRLTSLGATLSEVSASRGTDPARLAGLVRPELDWIVMKALEKDRNRRYETATGFAADVLRFLAGEPVQAVPPTLGYRLRKAFRKNRAAVLTASGFALLLVAGAALSLWQAARATDAEVGEKAQRVQAERNLDRAEAETNKAIKSEADALRARNDATAERDRVRALFYVSNFNLAQVAHAEQRAGRLRELLDELRPVPGQQDLRGFEWHYLDKLIEREPVFRLHPRGSRKFVSAHWLDHRAPFSPDGRWAGVIRQDWSVLPKPKESEPWKGQWADCELEVFDTRTGKRALLHKAHAPINFRDFAISSAGWAAFGADQKVTLFDLATGQPIKTIDLDRPVRWLNCDAGGTRLATVLAEPGGAPGAGPRQHSITVWDVASGRAAYAIPSALAAAWSLDRYFSPDGKRLATRTGHPQPVEIRTEGAKHAVPLEGAGDPVGWAGNDRFVTAPKEFQAARDEATVWDVVTGAQVRTVTGFPDGRTATAVSPDGRWLAVGLETGCITVIDLADRQPPRTLWGHEAAVSRMAFDGGDALVSLCREGEVRRHDLTRPEVRRFAGDRPAGYPGESFSGDGSRMATVTSDARGTSLLLWDVFTGRELWRLPLGAPREFVTARTALGQAAARAAVLTLQGLTPVNDATFHDPHFALRTWAGLPGAVPLGFGDLTGAAWTARPLAPVVERVRVLDAAGRVVFDRSREHRPRDHWQALLSPAGRYLWLGDRQRWALHDLETGREVAAGRRTGKPDPDGAPRAGWHLSDDRLLLIDVQPGEAGKNRVEFRWWDVKDGRERGAQSAEVPPASMDGYRFDCSEDGRRVAISRRLDSSLAREQWVRVFDAAPDRLRMLVATGARELGGELLGAHLSPDGRWLAAGVDRDIHVWNLDEPGRPFRLTGHQNSAVQLAFSADGHRLAALDGFFSAPPPGQKLRVWDLRTRRELVALASAVRAIDLRFAGQRLVVLGLNPKAGAGPVEPEVWVLDGTPREAK